MYNPYENDLTKNKYQEPKMLFFKDQTRGRQGQNNTDMTRPRTIQEIKKLQNFVSSYKS